MSVIYIVFAIIAVPVLLLMVTWAVATAYRLIYPETSCRVEADPVAVRQRATAAGEHVPVGTREIREDQRYHRREHPSGSYVYHSGTSEGVPLNWAEDLWRRRN
ncbi:MAG: hypothetical protein ACE5G0_09685 [Rhodothermales bacterium]